MESCGGQRDGTVYVNSVLKPSTILVNWMSHNQLETLSEIRHNFCSCGAYDCIVKKKKQLSASSKPCRLAASWEQISLFCSILYHKCLAHCLTQQVIISFCWIAWKSNDVSVSPSLLHLNFAENLISKIERCSWHLVGRKNWDADEFLAVHKIPPTTHTHTHRCGPE